ncbi:MAG: DUF1592 domain-containing protein, partial [Verrucomicrobiales bacterium]|nr:DUF1592 domain-containing protein [Verrucomicrobiales bacterium]
LGAAQDGGIDIATQVDRMLDDPRARKHSARFAAEWLNLGRLANLSPNKHKFPTWNPALAADMRDETLAFFNHIAWEQKRPLGDLFNADFTFATPRLAKHYGLQPVSETSGRYDLSSVPSRGGIMTQGSILTVGGDEASMVTRGLFVLHDVLRGVVSDPPPGLDTTPVPTEPGLSQRKIAEQRLADKSCSACHTAFEPLAFGLEKYDGIGAHHDVDEHGNKLREDGNVVIPGADKPIPYKTADELMDILAANDRVHETITWKLAQFSLGRPLGARDAKVLRAVHQQAKNNNFTYQSLITALATSDLVTKSRTEPGS